MEDIKVKSTSLSSAITDPIILREKETRRLIFQPQLVENLKDKEASVNGRFIYQRKSKNDQWENINESNLSQLKSGEGIQLILSSSEILKLFNYLNDLYKIYKIEGIPFGEAHFIRANEGLASLLSTNEIELTQFLNNTQINVHELISRLLKWLSSIENPSKVIENLEQLEINSLQQLSSIVGISSLKSSYEIWEENSENSKEEFWQKTLSKYAFVLSQVFANPVIVVQGKAYVGGKGIPDSGGKLVDFLARNEVSKNAILIEIKTPKTELLGPEYRGVFSISRELSGSIVQVANYKHNLEHEFSSLKVNSEIDIESFEPKCVIIAGNQKKELNDPIKKKVFELFRSRLLGVDIITYDELFGKVSLLIDMLEGKISENQAVYEDDIPF